MNDLKITPEALETIENMIFYYHSIPVEELNKRRPGFVEEDLTKLLSILNTITETI